MTDRADSVGTSSQVYRSDVMLPVQNVLCVFALCLWNMTIIVRYTSVGIMYHHIGF